MTTIIQPLDFVDYTNGTLTCADQYTDQKI